MVSSYINIIPALLSVVLAASSPVTGQDATAIGIGHLANELTTARDVATRRKAAQALGRTGTARSVIALRRARVSEGEVQVRLAIVAALRTIAFQRYAGYRDALRGLAEAGNDDLERDALVRLRATEALWEAGKKDLLDPVPFMERQFTDRSQRLRLSAVEMLRKHGSVEAAEALGRAVINGKLSSTVRLAAIDALGAVALTEGGPVGRQIAAANIRAASALSLPSAISPRVLVRRHQRQIGYLTMLVRDPDASPTLVLRAVKSMGRIKDKSSIPILTELIETHPNDGVRKQATRVLSHVLAGQFE